VDFTWLLTSWGFAVATVAVGLVTITITEIFTAATGHFKKLAVVIITILASCLN
jgi:hypothetical protein